LAEKMKTVTLGGRVNGDDFKKFSKRCETEGVTTSEKLRQLVDDYLRSDEVVPLSNGEKIAVTEMRLVDVVKKQEEHFKSFEKRLTDLKNDVENNDVTIKLVEKQDALIVALEKQVEELQRALEKSAAKSLEQVQEDRAKAGAASVVQDAALTVAEKPAATPAAASVAASEFVSVVECLCGAEFDDADVKSNIRFCPGCGRIAPWRDGGSKKQK
jgi:hypothetical protein